MKLIESSIGQRISETVEHTDRHGAMVRGIPHSARSCSGHRTTPQRQGGAPWCTTNNRKNLRRAQSSHPIPTEIGISCPGSNSYKRRARHSPRYSRYSPRSARYSHRYSRYSPRYSNCSRYSPRHSRLSTSPHSGKHIPRG